jgi:tRNA nucleotidyltransferase/poly(A) polymerase
VKPDWLKALGRESAIRELEQLAADFDGDVFLVGGTLRDRALRRPGPLRDVDLAATSAFSFAKNAAKRLRGTLVTLDETERVYRVVCKAGKRRPNGLQIDVAEIQGKGIGDDLARRDFTINAMAARLPLGGEGLLDPFYGLKDLRKKIVRITSERVLREDPLRMLRAFRLAATLGLKLADETTAGIRRHRKKIAAAAGERVRTELLGILSARDSASWLSGMDETGLLTTVFPELERSRRCATVYYGEGGVLKHSLAVVARADRLLADPSKVYPEWGKSFETDLALGLSETADPRALIRLACLLHDVAKPACAKKIRGRLRFFGHEARGAVMSVDILKRLRFSSEEIETIRLCVHHHLRPGNLAANKTVSDKAVYRFFRDLGDHGIRLLAVCWADHASYLSPAALRAILGRVPDDPHTSDLSRLRNPDARKTLFHLQVVSYLLDQWFNRPETARPTRILDGNAVMKTLGIKAGPAVGEALAALSEAQAEGSVKNRSDALRFLKKRRT